MLCRKFPPPKGSKDAPCKLLLFDAFHDPYRGVIALVEVGDSDGQRVDVG